MDQQNTNNFLNAGEQPLIPPTSDERTWGVLAHILTLLTGLFGAGFVPPLIIYLVKKDESNYVAEQAKESLNFQITMIICYLIAWVLVVLLIGFLLLAILGLLQLILVIVASIKASESKIYRYPFCIRLIK